MPETRLDANELNEQFLADLGSLATTSSPIGGKPFEVVATPPLPETLRVYLYNLTSPPGGRPTGEHKIQLIAPGQQRDELGNFDFSGGVFVVLAGFSASEGVYVLWDATLHRDFSWSANAQVKGETVSRALSEGLAVQERHLRSVRQTETVVVVPTENLADGLLARAASATPIGGGTSQDASPQSLGVPYRVASEDTGSARRRVFEVDPDLFDRATNAHGRTQNELRSKVGEAGLVAKSPDASDPLFDLAWVDGDTAWVAEVKSLTLQNETRQIRYAIGQVLSYCFFLDWGVAEVVPVIALEREPSDVAWSELCDSIGIRLVWPEAFGTLFA